MRGLEDPGLRFGIAILGTSLILSALIINLALISKAVLVAFGAIPTILAFLNRHD